MSPRVALVTGASKGLGAATAISLARRGFAVVVNYLADEEAADAVLEQIMAAGPVAAPVKVQADVTSETDAQRLVQEALAVFGSVDVLVNNANIPHVQKPLENLTLAEFEGKITGELRAAFLMTQAVLPSMTAQHWGRLIYISTGHADGPAAPGMISSGSAKAALNTFAKYAAHELGRRNITANVVQCGMMNTPATRGVPPHFREAMANATPLGAIAEPMDVADAVAFFASDDSRFVSGALLAVNGGFGLSRFAPPNPAPDA